MKLCALLAATTLLFAPIGFAQQQDAAGGFSSPQSAQLQISQPTDVPGGKLSHGTYAVRISDRLQDRLIIQIQKDGGKDSISLLAYPNPKLRGGSFTGPVSFLTGLNGRPTLRGYAFPGGPVVEFVYPKKDAVVLAKANAVRVMAVDPASEGRVSLPNLTETDMSEVTLWMLTPTPVDPATSKPGIQAARYQAPSTPQPAPASQTAAATVPASPSPSAQSSYSAQEQPTTPIPTPRSRTKPAASAPVQVASNTHAPRLRPNVKELPHTASSLPLVFLIGCVAFGLAAMLTFRRLLTGL